MTLQIPHGWDEVELGDLYDLSNGVDANKTAYGSGVPFANVLEVITKESLSAADIPGRVNLPPAVVARYRVQYGDLLFNRTSETQEEVGLASVYIGHSPVVFGGFVLRARPKTKRVDVEFAKYAFRTHTVRQQIVARGQGGIRANIGQRDLRTVRVVLPPVDEQRELAATVSDVDVLIDGLGDLIVKNRDIKQGAMQHLLSGATRLPGYGTLWKEKKLGEVVSTSSGGTPPATVSRFYGGGIPWVSISDMTSSGKWLRGTKRTLSGEGLKISAAKLYPPGVVLYAMYASLGECSLAIGEVRSSQAILGIETGADLDSEFLYYYLQFIKPKVKLFGQQGAQSNLNAGMVRDFSINLPDIEEQRAIVEALSEIDDEIDRLVELRSKTRETRIGLMQELLTGRTRLFQGAAA